MEVVEGVHVSGSRKGHRLLKLNKGAMCACRKKKDENSKAQGRKRV